MKAGALRLPVYPEKGDHFRAEPTLRDLGTLWKSHPEQRGCAEQPELTVPLPQVWAWISCSSPNLSEQPGTQLDELP